MPTFFFVTAFQQDLGTVGTSIIGSIQTLAAAILATLFLLNIYETFARGGGVRGLIISVVKYSACALLIANWTTFFTGISAGFSAVAIQIGSTDFLSSFASTLTNSGGAISAWTSFSLMSFALITFLGAVLWGVVAIIYYVWMIIFSIIYTAWGIILFALGPLLVALLPSNATSSFAKHYLKSMAEWAAWPVLYAIMGRLTASMTTFTAGAATNAYASSVILAPLWNLLQNIVIAVIYICFLLVLPFLANHLINGDFGGTVGSTIKALATVATAGGAAVASGGAAVAGAKAAGGAASKGAGVGESLKAGGQAVKDSWQASHSHGGKSASPPPASPAKRLSASMNRNGDSKRNR